MLATTTATFTVDAWIEIVGVATFSVDAIILATPTASFTADVVISKEQTAAFTTDAVLQATSTATFTSDAIVLASGLMVGDLALPCTLAADADGSGRITLGDVLAIVYYIFAGGDAPAPPFPDCGSFVAFRRTLDCEESVCR